jgi:hypothetical protein
MTENEIEKTVEHLLAALPCTLGPDGRGCTETPPHEGPCRNGLVRWRAPQWTFGDWEIRWSRDPMRPQSVVEFDYRRGGEAEWERQTLLLSTDMEEQLKIFDRLRAGDEVVQHLVGLAFLGAKMTNVDGEEINWFVGWSFKDGQPVLSSLPPNALSSRRERRRVLERAQGAHRRLLDLRWMSQEENAPELLQSKAFKSMKVALEACRTELRRHEVEVDPVDEQGCWPTCGCAKE